MPGLLTTRQLQGPRKPQTGLVRTGPLPGNQSEGRIRSAGVRKGKSKPANNWKVSQRTKRVVFDSVD
jgi:hypothetical protein